MSEAEKTGLTYADAGVDIDAGNALVDRIKPLVRATRRPGADAEIGGFGGLFDLKAAGFKDPILVAANDGVGSKVKIAIETGRHSTIGIDLVAMCVNDLIVQGAEPLFFLDYFATGKLEPEVGAAIVEGIAEGCRMAGCALIGGETAEMPGLYAGRDYDLAGFSVGAAERGTLLPRAVAPGDVILGLPSSGVHSNGYSLVRRIVADSGLGWAEPAPFAPERRSRRRAARADANLREAAARRAAGNKRHQGAGAHHRRRFPRQHPARAARGHDGRDRPRCDRGPSGVRLARGAGARRRGGDAAHLQLRDRHDRRRRGRRGHGGDGEPRARGRVARRARPPHACRRGPRHLPRTIGALSRRRTAILISGRGSNMAALIEAARDPEYPAEIALVLSNRPEAAGLKTARDASIAVAAVDHKIYAGREEFERAMQALLEIHRIDLVCMAGFMRLVTPWFVGQWDGRMINIHPALLPSFRGLQTHERALEAGVKVHGCTVHFVVPQMDEGAIIAQAAVPVLDTDTPESLGRRVLAQEHVLYPAALARVARGGLHVQGNRVFDAEPAPEAPPLVVPAV